MTETVEINSIVIPDGRRGIGPLDALCQSISEVGLLNPVTLTSRCILIAGRNRVEACRRLGWDEIPANIVTLDEVDRQIAEIDENLIRNDLTVLERSEQFARRKVLYETKHPETKHGNGPGRGHTEKRGNNFHSFSDDTAAKANVTPRTVRQEVQIAQAIPADVREQLRQAPIADSKTELLKLARMPEAEQRAVAGKISSGESKNIKSAKKAISRDEHRIESAPETTKDYRLIVSDVAGLTEHVPVGSVDLILTDPPYPREFLPAYADLARTAANVLKPGGSMLVMVGQSYLPEVMALLASVEDLKYHWTLAYLTPGGQAVQLWQRKVNTFWKPVLWFVNGEYSGDWIGDVARSDVNDNDKRFHEWGQSESGIADLIERFSKPGDMILDPFLGGGTTGVVSVAMRRKFIGSDIDGEVVKVAANRLAIKGADES